MNEINEHELRRALIDYYGTAISLYPQAILKVEQIKRAPLKELIFEAQKINMPLDSFITYGRRR